MTSLPGIPGLMLDLAIVIFGFGLIIFVHELGHFLAARWAGIRTLAFAIGFGPAVVSYRRGIGLRRGSSEPEYAKLLERAAKDPTGRPQVENRRGEPVGHTEYRLNALPFGGYVKMLGQEDLNPAATSAAPDSYQNTPPWKRMIVISAGVVMNMITAAALFVLVFMIGLQTEPARIGAVRPAGPAAQAAALNATEAGVQTVGLRPGDALLQIDGRKPNSFNDLIMASAMARRGRPVDLTVARPGVDEPLLFSIVPERGDLTGLLDLGVEPPRTPVLVDEESPELRTQLREALGRFGLAGVEPGMRLVQTHIRGADPRPVEDAGDMAAAFRASGGAPVTLTFADEAGREFRATLEPRPVLQTTSVPTPGGRNSVTPIEHLLGFTPVMAVQDASERGAEQGLKAGDIFARIGEVAYPSLLDGATQIRTHAGETIPLVVLRRPGGDEAEAQGPRQRVALDASVRPDGTIGFYMTDADAVGAGLWLAIPPRQLRADAAPAARVVDRAGMRLVEAGGEPVADLADLRRALLAAAGEVEGQDATIDLVFELPIPAGATGQAPREQRELTLSGDEIRTLRSLGWTSPLPLAFFEPDQTMLRADNPAHAVKLGLSETYRVMAMTYVTFLRLFEGTVKVEHLKGPVGIAHLGTRIASRGLIWLLFFMALVSVNLAVINFLPLPIVDGGQFLFLLSEQIRGRPVPVAIQSMATMAGLVLIGAVFLVVTFNDIKALFGG